jgi:hypothetical protein
MTQIRGSELKVGDAIEVSWFGVKADIITGLRPYTGPLAYLFPDGAQLATFAVNRIGMTIDNGDYFEKVA